MWNRNSNSGVGMHYYYTRRDERRGDHTIFTLSMRKRRKKERKKMRKEKTYGQSVFIVEWKECDWIGVEIDINN